MQHLNIFNSESPLFSLRWFIVACIAGCLFMAFADTIGWRYLSFGNQQSWSASGPGSHK